MTSTTNDFPSPYLSFNQMQNRVENTIFFRLNSTGKEKDAETGYGYFGARYMDHELMTMWLSVDPMSDKYPSLSPYNYCGWNPIKVTDPDGRDWYKKGSDYYWDDKVIDKKSTPNGCTYIGNHNTLIEHFGISVPTKHIETKQWVRTLVGSNCESNNPYESKYAAFGSACARAESSMQFTIIYGKETGKLQGIRIDATLKSAVSDFGIGGCPSAFLKITYEDQKREIPFTKNNTPKYQSRDFNSYNVQNASFTIPATALYSNCVETLRIIGPWFSNNHVMTVPFTLGIVPSYLKHTY